MLHKMYREFAGRVKPWPPKSTRKSVSPWNKWKMAAGHDGYYFPKSTAALAPASSSMPCALVRRSLHGAPHYRVTHTSLRRPIFENGTEAED